MVLAAGPVAAIPAHSLLVFLLQVGLLLLGAQLLGRLGMRFGMPAVVGELMAGVLLGPSLLGNIAPGFTGWLFPADPAQFHLLDALGHIGVILLVGVTGMEMDVRLVRRRGMTAARVSLAGLLLPLGLGIAVGFMMPASLLAEGGDRATFALFLGVALCVSAIPVAAKILIDMNLLHRNVGQLTLASAVVDDAVGWLLLSVVSAMATTGVRGADIVVSVLAVFGTVVVAIFVGRPLARRALRLANASADGGPAVATATFMILGAAAATHAAGLEAILGAFVAGVVMGSAREYDEARIAPLRLVVLSVLAPLYFATAGLRIDLTALSKPVVLLAATVVLAAAIIGKFAGAYGGARASRLGHWEAVALGAGLNARGVIGLVVAAAGLRLGVLSTEVYTVVVLVAIVTTVMTPPILRAAMARVERDADEDLNRLDAAAQAARQAVTEPSGPPPLGSA